MLSELRLIRSNKYAGLWLMLFIMTQSYAQIKPTNATDRLNGMQNRHLLEEKSRVKEVEFRNIGPTIMSGRVVDVEVNPADPTEFYVAYATGGLWHTINNGQSFTPIFDSELTIGIGDIAVDWKTPRSIWVGTGEVNSSRSSYSGLGVYKSNDNGKTWQYLGLPESHHIGKIQLHPSDSNIAWVAVLGHLYSPNKERGVYKTVDGGKTWKLTLAIDENTGAIEMDANPSNPNELYAATWYRTRRAWNLEEAGKTSGIYKTVDGGDTWNLISGKGSGFLQGDHVGRIGLSVSTSSPSTVYAVVDNQAILPDTASSKKDTVYVVKDFKGISKEAFEKLDSAKLAKFLRGNYFPAKYTVDTMKFMVRNGTAKPSVIYEYLNIDDGFQKSVVGCEVYRSDDAGKSWHKTNEKQVDIFSTYGYYFSKIYVSPVNPEKVFILGITAQVSTDGGKTFKKIDKENVHADHHALWINPKRDSHIINGNDGGLNISYDDGDHWFLANSPAVAQYYSITVDNAKPYNIYGGLQDNGSWFGPSNNKENPGWQNEGEYAFTRINGGDGMQAEVDGRDNKIVYSGSQFGFYNRFTIGSKDKLFVRPLRDLEEAPLRFNWQTPILLSRHNQDILYVGTNKLYRSLVKGDCMQKLSDDLTNGGIKGDVPFGTISTMAESPLRFGLLYVGTDDGNLQLSRDGGYTWKKIGVPDKKNAGLPQGFYISRIVASQYKEGRIYVTLNGYRNDHFGAYVFVSEDYGERWTQLGKDLPMEPVNVLREDPVSEKILYVGTDGGAYVSVDGGNNFMPFTKGLPKSIPVHDIAIQKRENEIILATHGRSLYIAKLDKVQALK